MILSETPHVCLVRPAFMANENCNNKFVNPKALSLILMAERYKWMVVTQGSEMST